jgi:hypothetical protein
MESTASTATVDSSTFQSHNNNIQSSYSNNNNNNRWNEHYSSAAVYYGNGIGNVAETYYRNQLQQLNYPSTSNFYYNFRKNI